MNYHSNPRTPEEVRENVLANISEDMAKLMRAHCEELGRRKFLNEVADTPEWSRWNYTNERPKSAEEYALGNEGTSGAIKRVPDWASKRAIFDFLREEFEDDYATYVEIQREKGKWPAEEEADGE